MEWLWGAVDGPEQISVGMLGGSDHSLQLGEGNLKWNVGFSKRTGTVR